MIDAGVLMLTIFYLLDAGIEFCLGVILVSGLK